MSRNLSFLSIILLVAACKSASEPEAAREVTQYSIEQFLNTTSISGGSFSHDESRLLISSNQSGIFNAYSIPVTGGEPTALTQSSGSSVYAVSFFPEDDRLLYSADNNGNELYHLFVKTEDGQVTDLTPDTTARAQFYGWAKDDRHFYYGYNSRDHRFMDVYQMDIEGFKPTLLYQNDQGMDFGGISGDQQWMALSKSINTNDADLYLYHFPDKKLTKINSNQAGHSPADFSVDNQYLYYLTDDGSEYSYLAKYELASGTMSKELETNWDISYAYFSHNGKYRVVGINEDGKTVVQVAEAATGKAVNFPQFDSGDITGVNISRSENQVSFMVGSSSSPNNLYHWAFGAGDAKKLTNTMNPEINVDDLVTAEVVRFPSFDELKIPAIYYKPKQASSENKVPALVLVHGGPGGQSRQNYSAMTQYLVNHGYAVLAVNNRGSSGYGKTFFQMDDQNHGDKDLRDCLWGKEWLAQQPYIDSSSIGIIGGSYGGFMVMAALTQYPEAFDVGVNLFGVTNWIRTLRSIPPWWESFKDALYLEMGNPNTADSVRLYNISPLFHADKVARPLMVLQGSTDPRVLQVESDEIVDGVRKNNIPVEYVLFPDEGHGFVKKNNQAEAYSRILKFLDQHLKQAGDKVKG